MPPTPSVSSFLIADQVFQQKSGKWCVIGVFSKIYAISFPSVHSSLGLFVVLSDALGEYQVKLEFCDSVGRVLGKFEGIRLTARNRLDSGEFGIQTHGLPLPTAGRYFFRLYFNNELVRQDIALDAIKVDAIPGGLNA